jgi:hypothetical protein
MPIGDLSADRYIAVPGASASAAANSGFRAAAAAMGRLASH